MIAWQTKVRARVNQQFDREALQSVHVRERPTEPSASATRTKREGVAETHMDVLRPELLVQALAKRTLCELSRCKRARRHVPAEAPGRASKDERAALPLRVDCVLLESGYNLVRERECAMHVRVRDLREVCLGDVEEALAHSDACVPERRADLGRGPISGPCMRADSAEDVGERLVAVRLDGERDHLRKSCMLARERKGKQLGEMMGADLAAGLDELICGLLELFSASGDERDTVSGLCKYTAKTQGAQSDTSPTEED